MNKSSGATSGSSRNTRRNCSHLVSRPVGQIGERALAGRTALAPALAQQNRRGSPQGPPIRLVVRYGHKHYGQVAEIILIAVSLI